MNIVSTFVSLFFVSGASWKQWTRTRKNNDAKRQKEKEREREKEKKDGDHMSSGFAMQRCIQMWLFICANAIKYPQMGQLLLKNQNKKKQQRYRQNARQAQNNRTTEQNKPKNTKYLSKWKASKMIEERDFAGRARAAARIWADRAQ